MTAAKLRPHWRKLPHGIPVCPMKSDGWVRFTQGFKPCENYLLEECIEGAIAARQFAAEDLAVLEDKGGARRFIARKLEACIKL